MAQPYSRYFVTAVLYNKLHLNLYTCKAPAEDPGICTKRAQTPKLLESWCRVAAGHVIAKRNMDPVAPKMRNDVEI